MALTADVKDELTKVEVSKTTVRAAELATILRFSGGLHLIGGRIAVESELDTPELARRVRKDLAELYGVRSDVSVISASGASWMPGAGRSAASRTVSPPVRGTSSPPSGAVRSSPTAR